MKLIKELPLTLIVSYPSTYPDAPSHDFQATVNVELEELQRVISQGCSVLNLVFTELHKDMASGNPLTSSKTFLEELNKIKDYKGEVYIDIRADLLSIEDTSFNIYQFSKDVQEEVALSELALRINDFRIQNSAYNSDKDIHQLLIKYLQRY